MKTKTFSKKLTLNKKTVADLRKKEMGKVHGGHDSSPSCPLATACKCTRPGMPCDN